MPLTKEFRLFFLDNMAIFSTEYWEEGDYQGLQAPTERFRDVARSVTSRFFTMDVAKCKDVSKPRGMSPGKVALKTYKSVKVEPLDV